MWGLGGVDCCAQGAVGVERETGTEQCSREAPHWRSSGARNWYPGALGRGGVAESDRARSEGSRYQNKSMGEQEVASVFGQASRC